MQIEVEGPRADRAAAWAQIANPEPFLRAAGLPPIHVLEIPDEDFEITLRVKLLGPVGMRHEGEERSAGWVHQDRLWFRWKVRGPVLTSVTYEAELVPDGDGVRPRIRLTLDTWTPLVSPLVVWAMRMASRVWTRRLSRLPPPGGAAKPTVRRQLDVTVEAALSRWADRRGDPVLIGRVRRLLVYTPDWSLDRLCPRALAQRWDLPLARVLDGLVSAAAAGVFGIAWQVHCPRCCTTVAHLDALSALGGDLTCGRCRAAVNVDLTRTVSAVLTVPTITAADRYVVDSPARSLDVVASALVGPGRGQVFQLHALPCGPWRLVTGVDAEDVHVDVHPDGPTEVAWHAQDGPTRLRMAPNATLQIHPHPHRRNRVRLIRAETAPPRRLSALAILSHPGWRRVLGRPGLAPRTVADVDDVTVLFTDLTHTAPFYAAAGDRIALQFVQAHQAVVEQAVESAGGVVIKSLGDGCMAVFSSPLSACRAGLDVLLGFDRWCRARALAAAPELRIGVARGHALAMRTDTAGFDLFGATVNVASRAVYGARPGTLRWTHRVAESPGVAALLDTLGAHDRVAFCDPDPEASADSGPGG